MTSSDWGDWLPRTIASAEPDGVSLWYLGCNGFALKADDGTTLFIDPYLGTGDPPRTIRMIPIPFDPQDIREADAILATHEHSDHVDAESQAPIMAETSATLYGSHASIDATKTDDWAKWELDRSQFATISPGDRVTIGSFTIAIEPAHDPDAAGDLSYLIQHDAGTIFHGGDTRPGEAFQSIGNQYEIDIAIAAFGTTGMIPDKQTRIPKRTRWYNDENQVIEIASALKADRLLPTHWDMWKGLTADPTVLHHHMASYEYPTCLEIVEIGDRIDL